jgi:hypothetical protein
MQALKEMKNNKAAGIDGIPAEILKADLHVTADALLRLFTEIWISETIPDEWERGMIVKIGTHVPIRRRGRELSSKS